jgi:hypothetical protein
MVNCPRWDKCSAAICPLEADWETRKHLDGDRVCFWMTETVKPDAKANFDLAAQGEMIILIQTLIPSICARWHPIKNALERASKSGSKLTSLSRNRKYLK